MIHETCKAVFGNPIWAQVDRYNAMGTRFRADHDGGMVSLPWIIAGVVVLGAVVAFVVYRTRQREGTPFRNPRRLFRDLCRVHQLGGAERRLLKRLAALQGVSDPANLFVDPAYFAVPSGDRSLRAQQAQIEALRQRLFADELHD